MASIQSLQKLSLRHYNLTNMKSYRHLKMNNCARLLFSSQPQAASKDITESTSGGAGGSSSKESRIEGPKKKRTAIVPPSEGFVVKKPSFVKELTLGRFDTDMMTYPEVLDKERYETLHEMLEPIERFFRDEVDSKTIDREGKIPDKVLQGIKDLGLYGQQIPLEYGGLGLNATEYARLQEIVSSDGGIAVTLAAHQTIGFKGILLYGNEEQKRKYLPKFASGEWLAAFALTEPNAGSDAGSVQTKATLNKDGTWTLNGSKIWISNGGTADFFTVFARTADDNVTETSTKRVTAFLVERSFGGVTSGKSEDKLGIRGSNTAEVFFENTVVPRENVLGEPGDGFKIAVNILNSGRFSMGSAVAGGMRRLMAAAAEYAVNRKQFTKPLMEFGLIKEKFARIAMHTYAMESMAYLTAGMLDNGEHADCAVEAAIVKVYASEAAWTSGSELLQIFGGSGYMKDLPYERNLRDARILSIFEGTNEILRLFIALMSLQHAGKELKELVKKMRNPFQNPTLMFQKVLQRQRNSSGNPKLTIGLRDYLHPTLGGAADQLERNVHRLQYATEVLLSRHGAKVSDPENQIELKRLADSLIDIYAMTCVLARASRSYCIGLAEAQTEIILAQAFVSETAERVELRLQDLICLNSTALMLDRQMQIIADQIFKNKGYFAEHPLKRTFW